MTPDLTKAGTGAAAAGVAALVAQFAPPMLPSGPVVGFGQFLAVGLVAVLGTVYVDL